MNSNWWWNKTWVVRANDKLATVLNVGDEFYLEPENTQDTPLFFWFRPQVGVSAGGKKAKPVHECWKNRYFYPVGVNPTAIPILSPWNSNGSTKAEYEQVAANVRRSANNPFTARLEGRILVDGRWEIVRLIPFRGAQENGRDWIVIDILMSDGSKKAIRSGMKTLEDGTAHGDPK